VIPILDKDPESAFPALERALDYPNGLLAVGGDLSQERLLNAYRHGIFPWYSGDEPILWWSPAPRCVLYPERVHISRRLRRRYNHGDFTLTADQAFGQVIEACALPRSEGSDTWITQAMKKAYNRLHKNQFAHSIEVWQDRELAGGIYGLALGRVFFGESMFSRVTDASKVALVSLCRQLRRWGFTVMDCQVGNPHLTSMGAVDIPRAKFEQHLKDTQQPDLWKQTFNPDIPW